MPDRTESMAILMHHSPRQRYRCNQCQRVFMVSLRDWETGNARCPACLGDDVTAWFSRRDRLLHYLMLHEVA
jgi:hypothetical protein